MKYFALKYPRVFKLTLLSIVFIPSYYLYFNDQISAGLCYSIVMAGALFIWVTSRNITIKEIKRIRNLMDEECDPYLYLENMDKMSYVYRSKRSMTGFLINKSAGLICCGKFNESIELLLNIEIYKSKPLLKVIYYNSLVTAYFESKEIEKAQLIIYKIQEVFSSFKFQKKHELMIQRLLKVKQSYINMIKGDYSDVESVFIDNLDVAIIKRQKVNANLMLGRLYILQNRFDEAKPVLQFVIDEGNKLYDATVARQLIAML